MQRTNVSSHLRLHLKATYPSLGISTATAYLTGEVLGRPNLTIAVSTSAEKILFSTGSDETPTAVGVQLSTGRLAPKYAVSAKREVIICAGAVASPQLLLVSGVGPASLLKTLQIPVVRDLHHVGRNLYDVHLPFLLSLTEADITHFIDSISALGLCWFAPNLSTHGTTT